MTVAKTDINNSLNKLILLPAKRRLDFIINHPSPLKLVRELPAIEHLLTIREVGAEDALELVELLSPAQVQEIFDLELWSSDALLPQVAGHYFSLLFEANREKAVAQIHGLDVELIGLMLKMVADIYEVNEGDDFHDDIIGTSSLTPDGRFLICFKDDAQTRGLATALRLFLESLYERDMPYALRLIDHVRYELSSVLEEECLRLRSNRLLDFGILPREERLEFFAPLSVESRKYTTTNNISTTSPTSLVKIFDRTMSSFPFLENALQSASDDVRERFWLNFVHVSTNMYASWSGDFGDRQEFIKACEYCKFLCDLGLFQACRGQIKDAATIFSQHSSTYFIRLGRSALLLVKKRLAQKMREPHFVFGPDFCHVDSPLQEVARAISLPEPRYYEGLLDPTKLTVRFFRNVNELNASMHAVNEIIARAEIISALGTPVDTLTHANMYARALVHGFCRREPSFGSINSDDLTAIFHAQKLKEEFTQFAKQFAENIALKLLATPELQEKIHQFSSMVLIQLEQNWQLALNGFRR